MGTERIPRLLTRFALPALLGMLVDALYNIVDRIFVGQIVGASGIAAIALAFPCMMLFLAAALLIGTGAASRISILLGEKRGKTAEKTLGNAFLLTLLLSVSLWIFGRTFFREILLLSGASPTLYDEASEYLSIVMNGMFFFIISLSFSYQIRACGSPVYATASQVVGAAANILLDAWFILGLGMGIRGAALATVASQFLSMLWTLSYFCLPKATLKLRAKYIVHPDVSTWKRILAVGIPSCLIHFNFVFVHAVITNTSSQYGGDLAVSATGIFMSLDSLLFMPAIAISEACQPIIGYNFGSGRIDRIITTIKIGVLSCTVFYAASFLLLMLHAELLVMMFNSKDKELITLAARAVRIANMGIPVMGISLVCGALLQGLGRGREGLWLAFVRLGVLLWVPLVIFPKYFGVYGAWGSFMVSDFLGSAIAGWSILHTIRRLRNGAIALPDKEKPRQEIL